MNNAQYGFKKGVSTSDALSDLTGFISLNKKKYCATLSIDLKKAFDSISHDILIIKLEKYGFRGVVLKLLVSFLSNRNQCVSYNSSKSQLNNIKYGVLQGSVLGPLLFLIFINDILNIKSLGHFVLFADDTSITFCNIIYIIRHAHIISDKHFTCILAVKPIALTLIYNR